MRPNDMTDQLTTLEPHRASALRRTGTPGAYEFTTYDGEVHRTAKSPDGQVTVTPPLRGMATFRNLVALEVTLLHRDPVTRQYMRRDGEVTSQTKVKEVPATHQPMKAHIEPASDTTTNPETMSIEDPGADAPSGDDDAPVAGAPAIDKPVTAIRRRDRHHTDDGTHIYLAGLVGGKLRLLTVIGTQMIDVLSNEAWEAWPPSFEFKRHYGLGCGPDVERAIVSLYQSDFKVKLETAT